MNKDSLKKKEKLREYSSKKVILKIDRFHAVQSL